MELKITQEHMEEYFSSYISRLEEKIRDPEMPGSHFNAVLPFNEIGMTIDYYVDGYIGTLDDNIETAMTQLGEQGRNIYREFKTNYRAALNEEPQELSTLYEAVVKFHEAYSNLPAFSKEIVEAIDYSKAETYYTAIKDTSRKQILVFNHMFHPDTREAFLEYVGPANLDPEYEKKII